MKVGIIGSGGREHALCYAINKSDRIDKVYCIPGNAGTNEIATNVETVKHSRLLGCLLYEEN